MTGAPLPQPKVSRKGAGWCRLLLLVLAFSLAAWTSLAEDGKKADAGPGASVGESGSGGATKSGGEGVVNKLLAPGPLIIGHQDLEHGDCLRCHDVGNGVPSNKCLSCHTDIERSIKQRRTFHGLTKAPCMGCHSDHKGRVFDSTVVQQKGFDHGTTGFNLHGAHAHLSCAKCHTEKRRGKPVHPDGIRYFGKTETCVGCHKKDDVHLFPAKWAEKDCNTCHNDKSWKAAIFDHHKETGYALVGDHAKIKCAACHTPKDKPVKYKFPELKTESCRSCHVDFHKDKFDNKFRGGNCDKCHNQDSWKLPHFDHNETGFSLRGAHAHINCVACHKQGKNAQSTPLKNFVFSGLGNECVSCHLDYHGFRAEKSPKLGALSLCQSCHTEAAWKSPVNFNHNTQTSYPITGKHIGVKCFACHLPESGDKHAAGNVARHYNFPSLDAKTCELCHESPHKNATAPAFRGSKCTSCHTTDGWKIFKGASGSGFNHSTMTRFALTGDHLKVSCNGCHLKNGKQIYKFAGESKNFCESCHSTPHKQQLSDKAQAAACSSCHDTVTFRNLSKYNHNEARFHLLGAHQQIAAKCRDCHTPTKLQLPVKRPRAAGKFLFEHPATGFCIDCHKNIHKEQFDEHFSSDNCQSCHNVQKWSDLSAFDHTKTRFPLNGAHGKLKSDCIKCHIKTAKMLHTTPPKPAGKFLFTHAGQGFCEDCHKSVHAEQFDEKFRQLSCRECHTALTWDKRLPFEHNSTKFKIVGAHSKIAQDCSKCHIKSKKMLPLIPPKPAAEFLFSHGKEGYCEDCHQNEHKAQFHNNFSTAPCIGCHVQSDFDKHNKFDHSKSRYPLMGKHVALRCVECHTATETRYKEPPHHFKDRFIWADLTSKDCALCHKDPHKGNFGKRCSECHSENGWDKTASFHKDYVLSGVHNLLACTQCHEDRRSLTGTGNDCKTCHQKDDVHMGTQPECAECHIQQFWSVSRFQHSLTDFPLRGAHRLLECSTCHAQGVYEGKNPDCLSCHFDDAQRVSFPSHKGAGFQQCDDCHNQFLFRAVK